MRISASFLALSLVIGAGLSLPAVAKADIIQNGDFTFSNYTFPGYGDTVAGWTIEGATGFDTGGFFNNGSLPNGDSSVGFLQVTGTATQTMTGLVAGQAYELTFLYNARSLDGDNCCNADPTFTVSVGGTQLGSSILASAVGGTNPFDSASYSFVADSTSEDLVFASSTGGADGTLLLSGVSVVAATPEPSSLMLLGTGLLGVCGLARRRFSKV